MGTMRRDSLHICRHSVASLDAGAAWRNMVEKRAGQKRKVRQGRLQWDLADIAAGEVAGHKLRHGWRVEEVGRRHHTWAGAVPHLARQYVRGRRLASEQRRG